MTGPGRRSVSRARLKRRNSQSTVEKHAMNPWFMALTISAILLGAAILFFSITRIFALLRDSEVTRLPAVSQGEVTFDEAGTYVLPSERPPLNTALLNAQVPLPDPSPTAASV